MVHQKDFLFQRNWTAHMWIKGWLASYQQWKVSTGTTVTHTKRHSRHHWNEIEHHHRIEFVNCMKQQLSKTCYSEENTSFPAHIMNNYTKLLQPTNIHYCTVLSLLNTAQTNWVSVDCHQKILSHVVCFTPANMTQTTSDQMNKTCEKFELYFDSKCYSFFWSSQHGRVRQMTQACNKDSDILLFSKENKQSVFHLLLESTSLTSINVASLDGNNSKSQTFFVLRKYWSKTAVEESSKSEGFCACVRKPTQLQIESNALFRCDGGYFVSSAFVCHSGFSCKISSTNSEYDSLFNKCAPGMKPEKNKDTNCSPLLYKTTDGTCQTFLTQQILPTNTKDLQWAKYKCYSGQSSIPAELVDDTVLWFVSRR